jgi:hypothetical protein
MSIFYYLNNVNLTSGLMKVKHFFTLQSAAKNTMKLTNENNLKLTTPPDLNCCSFWVAFDYLSYLKYLFKYVKL